MPPYRARAVDLVTAPDGYGTDRRQQRARLVSYGVDHRFFNLPEGSIGAPSPLDAPLPRASSRPCHRAGWLRHRPTSTTSTAGELWGRAPIFQFAGGQHRRAAPARCPLTAREQSTLSPRRMVTAPTDVNNEHGW